MAVPGHMGNTMVGSPRIATTSWDMTCTIVAIYQLITVSRTAPTTISLLQHLKADVAEKEADVKSADADVKTGVLLCCVWG